MIKLIIFDLDDTLYDEKSYVTSGFKAVASFLSKRNKSLARKIFNKLVESFQTHGRGKNFDIIIKEFGLNNVDIKKLVDIFRNHLPQIKLYPEARRALAFLEKTYPLVLLTNGWLEAQKNKVSALGLEKYFDSIFYAQENGLQFRKPHPEYFLRVANRYHLKPNEILMVGDDPISDIGGARKLGFKTRLIRNPRDLKNIIKF